MSESPTPSPVPAPSPTPGYSRKRMILEQIISLAMALVVVFAIRSSLIEAFKIPSGSMIPTLLIGDHIFVNKLAYGLKVPFAEWFTKDPVYLVKRAPPSRGDIIVFIYPKDDSYFYIKRVVGVPGDTLEIRNKILLVNGQPVEREPVPTPDIEKLYKELDDPTKYSAANVEAYYETFVKAEESTVSTPVTARDRHLVFLDKNSFISDSHRPVTVPAESLFVMGDNRDFSNDSRFWGFVPYRNVKGKALFVWLSLWLGFEENRSPVFRWDRIGTVLHHESEASPATSAQTPPKTSSARATLHLRHAGAASSL